MPDVVITIKAQGNAAQFLQGLKEVVEKTEGATIDAGKSFKAAGTQAETFGKKTDKAEKEVREFGAVTEAGSRKTRQLGEKAKQLATGLEKAGRAAREAKGKTDQFKRAQGSAMEAGSQWLGTLRDLVTITGVDLKSAIGSLTGTLTASLFRALGENHESSIALIGSFTRMQKSADNTTRRLTEGLAPSIIGVNFVISDVLNSFSEWVDEQQIGQKVGNALTGTLIVLAEGFALVADGITISRLVLGNLNVDWDGVTASFLKGIPILNTTVVMVESLAQASAALGTSTGDLDAMFAAYREMADAAGLGGERLREMADRLRGVREQSSKGIFDRRALQEDLNKIKLMMEERLIDAEGNWKEQIRIIEEAMAVEQERGRETEAFFLRLVRRRARVEKQLVREREQEKLRIVKEAVAEEKELTKEREEFKKAESDAIRESYELEMEAFAELREHETEELEIRLLEIDLLAETEQEAFELRKAVIAGYMEELEGRRAKEEEVKDFLVETWDATTKALKDSMQAQVKAHEEAKKKEAAALKEREKKLADFNKRTGQAVGGWVAEMVLHHRSLESIIISIYQNFVTQVLQKLGEWLVTGVTNALELTGKTVANSKVQSAAKGAQIVPNVLAWASEIPFVGPGIAAAQIAIYQGMLASLGPVTGSIAAGGIGGAQEGGSVDGIGGGDRIPFLLEPGEFVVERRAAEAPGARAFLEDFNAGTLGGAGGGSGGSETLNLNLSLSLQRGFAFPQQIAEEMAPHILDTLNDYVRNRGGISVASHLVEVE